MISFRDLTESLTDLSATEWRTILAKLRRARLVAGADPHNPGDLDTHPLVREYFGEQLRSQRTEAWKECNRRLYYYYRDAASQLPDSFREMEPLFLAVICGCNAGLFHKALNEVYIPRIQRGDAFFAAKVLGARGALLSVLVHSSHAGKMIMTIFAGIAEFERDLIRERTGAGREAAKKRGVQFGRPPKLTPDQRQLARRLVSEGKSVREIASVFNVHAATIYRLARS